MRIHQIRYNVEILPYDLVWNLVAVALIIVGVILVFRTRKQLSQGEEILSGSQSH